jgi:hypothetical protein
MEASSSVLIGVDERPLLAAPEARHSANAAACVKAGPLTIAKPCAVGSVGAAPGNRSVTIGIAHADRHFCAWMVHLVAHLFCTAECSFDAFDSINLAASQRCIGALVSGLKRLAMRRISPRSASACYRVLEQGDGKLARLLLFRVARVIFIVE